MNLLAQYHLYIMIAVAILPFVLPTEHKRNKLVITIVVLLAISVIYEVAMKEPITKMPSRIMTTLNQSGADETANPHYHKTPETRYQDNTGNEADFNK